MEAYQTIQYRPTFPVDEAGRFMYEYNKKKNETLTDKYSGNSFGLYDILKADEKTLTGEIESIETQIAERERIKRRNVLFLEDQRRKLEYFLNTTECFTYKPSGFYNLSKNFLIPSLVKLAKGLKTTNLVS